MWRLTGAKEFSFEFFPVGLAGSLHIFLQSGICVHSERTHEQRNLDPSTLARLSLS